MASANERIYRSLRGLEKTASTSRVLNLAAVSVRNIGNEEHAKTPLFKSGTLNSAVILKHRLRMDEVELFEDMTGQFSFLQPEAGETASHAAARKATAMSRAAHEEEQREGEAALNEIAGAIH